MRILVSIGYHSGYVALPRNNLYDPRGGRKKTRGRKKRQASRVPLLAVSILFPEERNFLFSILPFPPCPNFYKALQTFVTGGYEDYLA